jgi:large subunit ribosomal protein L23
MPRYILIKPLISEKAEKLSAKEDKYTFVVDNKANKIEIKQAVEAMYSVTVTDVNTLRMPGKSKSRFTKTGVVRGQKPAYKKAIVKLVEGDSIDLFGAADEE